MAVIESIKYKRSILTPSILLIILTFLFVNLKVTFTFFDFIPSFSLLIKVSIVTGLVLIGFYFLRRIFLTDKLTGLYNRKGFFSLAEHRLKITKRQKSGLLILYADVDNLKEINDAYGHEEGDNLLKEIANILKSTYRESDIIARFGGNEFLVFPLGTTKAHIEVISSRLQNVINDYNTSREDRYKLSVSIEISAYEPESVTTIDELLAEVDRLIYEHKRNKKRS
ncbi:MAG: GGDEF domain-containing protein [Promethearchaeota archaeon]|jgi:diguanylate cyclase (GGDEF)-like protein